jgi:histidinol phosphatase-like enzyme
MIDDAIRKWKINKNKSLLIGDQLTDIQAAKNSKIKHSILLNNSNILKFLDHKFFK